MLAEAFGMHPRRWKDLKQFENFESEAEQAIYDVP
jgi:hypothetical protein